ncbi:putative structural protein [Polaromonas phage Tiera]|nr:putative structural protein [Polaromonas phage Tiera]
MGALSSIANRFVPRNANAAPQQGVNGGVQPPLAATSMQFSQNPTQMQGNGAGAPAPANGATVPGNFGQQDPNASQQQQPKTGIDKFDGMFDTSGTAPEAAPGFSLDEKQFGEFVGKQDFLADMPQDLQQRIQAGDPAAFMEALQYVGRQSYSKAIQHGGKMTETFVGAREQHSAKGFGSKLKQELTANSFAEDPKFQNPVVKKQLNMIAQNISNKNPNLTPSEVKAQAVEYMTEMSKIFNPAEESSGNARAPQKNVDFNEWFGDGTDENSGQPQDTPYF